MNPLSSSSTSSERFPAYSLVYLSQTAIVAVLHCHRCKQFFVQAYEMAMDKEIRSTLSAPMVPLGSGGSRWLRGRWQWPPTIAVGEPCRTVVRGLQVTVGIASRGRDGVVDGLIIWMEHRGRATE